MFCAVTGQGTVNQAGVSGGQFVVSDAQPFRHAGSKVFYHDIGLGGQTLGSFAPGVGFEVQDYRAFAPIPGSESRLGTGRISAGPFHLDDMSALVGQQHPQHRAGYILPELYDMDVAQCAAGG